MIKEQERAELHRAIWQIANDLRGSVDGWDFKQYVLGMLFTASSAKFLPSTSMKTNGVTAIKNLITLNLRIRRRSLDGQIR